MIMEYIASAAIVVGALCALGAIWNPTIRQTTVNADTEAVALWREHLAYGQQYRAARDNKKLPASVGDEAYRRQMEVEARGHQLVEAIDHEVVVIRGTGR